MKKTVGGLLLLLTLAGAIIGGITAKAAAASRSDIVRTNQEGFGAWWQNRASGLVDTGTMMCYETTDGQVAYCLSNKKGHPDGVEYCLSGNIGMTESFGEEEQAALMRIIKAGYPLSRDYWRQKGLTDLDMRGATQIAIWYVQAQLGTDEHTGGSWKNGTWGNLGSRDVKSMIDALVQYGLHGGSSPVSRTLSLTSEGTVILGEEMVSTFRISVTGLETWTAVFTGLPEGAVASVNGKAVDLINSSVTGTDFGELELSVRYPCKYGKYISCTLKGYTTNNTASMLYYQPEDTAAQDIMLFQTAGLANGGSARVITSTPAQKGKIRLLKQDAETRQLIQEGKAVYGVFLDEGAATKVSEIIVEKGTGLSEALDLGTYYLKELEAPLGYVLSKDITQVTLQGDTTEQEFAVKEMVTADLPQKGRIKLRKIDAFTKEPITAEARFSVVNALTGETVQYMDTDETGEAVSDPLPLSGIYQVWEVSAPKGYTALAEPSVEVTFSPTADGRAEILQEYSVENHMQTGSVRIQKTGDGIRTAVSAGDGLRLQYEKTPLAGVVYGIYAAEDIRAADGPGTVLTEAGTEIAVVWTDENGKAKVSGLWPGRYIIKELAGKEGYIQEIQEQTFEIQQDAGQEELMFHNERQLIQIYVEKRDISTQEGLEGAVCGLYLGEELEMEDGTVLCEDTLLEVVTTDENGIGRFQEAVPIGYRYYVREIKAPEGYCLSEEAVYLQPLPGSQKAEPQSVVLYNEPKENSDLRIGQAEPGTGDTNYAFLWGSVAALTGGMLLWLCSRYRKQKEKR